MARPPRKWKKVYVPVLDDCMECVNAVCERCAPYGGPEDGDLVACPWDQLDLLRQLTQMRAQIVALSEQFSSVWELALGDLPEEPVVAAIETVEDAKEEKEERGVLQ